MAPDVASRPSMSAPSAIAPEVVGFATCPLCHTSAPTLRSSAPGGDDWLCSRCGQQWDTTRLATVAAYVAWLSERAGSSANHPTTAGGDKCAS
jgi:hypothetical protein